MSIFDQYRAFVEQILDKIEFVICSAIEKTFVRLSGDNNKDM